MSRPPFSIPLFALAYRRAPATSRGALRAFAARAGTRASGPPAAAAVLSNTLT